MTEPNLDATETKGKHTAGPWVAVFSENGGYDCMTDSIDIRVDAEGFQPSIVYIDRGRDPDATMERDWANARLIAAAPDMLAALRKAADKLGNPELYSKWPVADARIAIEDAIAKAEGRS